MYACFVLFYFSECPDFSEDYRESQELLQNLKEERMSKKLSTDNILSYDITWTPEGRYTDKLF